jgi:hypothetical protein
MKRPVAVTVSVACAPSEVLMMVSEPVNESPTFTGVGKSGPALPATPANAGAVPNAKIAIAASHLSLAPKQPTADFTVMRRSRWATCPESNMVLGVRPVYCTLVHARGSFRRANEILRKASAFFAQAELDRSGKS